MKPYGVSFQANEGHCHFLPVDLGKWYYHQEEELIGPFQTEEAAERSRLSYCKSCEE